jgi:alpha/beta superfamily hydrolase
MAEEHLTIGPPARALEAALSLPAGPARAGAVVCHPHPQYGGTMDNPVVVAIGDALVDAGVAVLRFNFAGVGRSAGAFTGGPGEVGDVRAAIDALAARLPVEVPLLLVGYSFGAWAALGVAAGVSDRLRRVFAVGPPLAFLDWGFLTTVSVPITFVVGDRDQFCPSGRLASTLGAHAGIVCCTIPGADHFFADREREVGKAVADTIREDSF